MGRLFSILSTLGVLTLLACTSSSSVENVEGATIVVPLLPQAEITSRLTFQEYEVADDALTVLVREQLRFAEGDARYPRAVTWRMETLGWIRCWGPGTFEFTSIEGGGSGFDVQAQGDALVLHAGSGEATFTVRGHFISGWERAVAETCIPPEDEFSEADIVMELTLSSEVPADAALEVCRNGAYLPNSRIGVSAETRDSEGREVHFINVVRGRGVDIELSADMGTLLYEPWLGERSWRIPEEVRLPSVPGAVRITPSVGASEALSVIDPPDVLIDVALQLGPYSPIGGNVVDGLDWPDHLPWIQLEFGGSLADETPFCGSVIAEVGSNTPAVCADAEFGSGFELLSDGRCELEWTAAGRTETFSFEVRNVDLFENP